MMPVLGAAICGEWALDSGWLSVHYGSYGAAAKPVLAAQQDWPRQMAERPTRFFSHVLPGAVGAASAPRRRHLQSAQGGRLVRPAAPSDHSEREVPGVADVDDRQEQKSPC